MIWRTASGASAGAAASLRGSLDLPRPRPLPLLVRDAEPAGELPPQVDDPREAVDRASAEPDVALVGDRGMDARGDAERRQVRQAAHRGGSLEAVAAELRVAVGELEQVRP